jgi:hypothetical protein
MFERNSKQIFNLITVLTALVILGAACSEDNPTPLNEDHFEAVGLKLRQNGVDIVTVANGQVSGEIEAIEGLTTTLISVRFIDEDGDEGIPQGDEFGLNLNINDESIATIVQHAGEDWSFHVKGEAHGEASLTVSLLHGDHADFESPPIPIHVAEPGAEKEAVGLVIIEEDSGDTLVTVNVGAVSGRISVPAGQTSEHLAIFFLDENGETFQPSPAEHALSYINANAAIAEAKQFENETYEMIVEGKQAGSTTFVIRLLHAGDPEFDTPDIPVTVTP